MPIYRYAIILLIFLAGCGGGGGGEGVASPDSTILISPSEITYEPYRGTDLPVVLGPKRLTVTVNNASGNPVRDATVTMYYAGDGSMISSNKNGDYLQYEFEPYVAKTDDFGNVYLYIIRGGTDRVGEVSDGFEAFSGQAYGNIVTTWTCEDTNTSTEFVCD